MDRPCLIRGLRIAVSGVFGVLCLLLVVLWVRSYHGEDRASGHFSNSLGVRFYSSRGWIVCSRNASVCTAAGVIRGRLRRKSEYWLDPDDDRLRFSVPNDFLGMRWLCQRFNAALDADAGEWRRSSHRSRLALPFLPPHSPNRHHADRGRAGAGGVVDATLTKSVAVASCFGRLLRKSCRERHALASGAAFPA